MVGDHPTCPATGDTAPDSNQRTEALPVSWDQMQGYMSELLVLTGTLGAGA